MKKGDKIALTILGFLAFGLLMAVLSLRHIANNKPVETVPPPSKLTNSLFDSQNPSYEKNSGLPQTIEFKNIPYLVDVPEAVNANVGNSTIFNLNSGYMFYVSEGTDKYEDIILSEYAKAELIDANINDSYIQGFIKESGYMNGYAMEYFISQLSVKNGQKDVEKYLVGYCIQIPEYEENVIICVVCDGYTNDRLESARDFCIMVISTLRFDEELERELEKEGVIKIDDIGTSGALEEKAVESLDDFVIPEINDEDESTDLEGLENEEDAQETESAETEEETKEYKITLDKEYKDLELVCNVGLDAIVTKGEFYNQNRTFSFSASKIQNGQVIFSDLGLYEKGDYDLALTGTGLEDVTFEKIDKGATN